MEDTKPHYDDEIDLVELVQTVWDGKWAIVGAVVVSVISVFGYQATQPQPNFEASTEIKPITSVAVLIVFNNSVDKATIDLIEMRQNESKSHVSFCLPFLFDRMIDRHSEVRKKR